MHTGPVYMYLADICDHSPTRNMGPILCQYSMCVCGGYWSLLMGASKVDLKTPGSTELPQSK